MTPLTMATCMKNNGPTMKHITSAIAVMASKQSADRRQIERRWRACSSKKLVRSTGPGMEPHGCELPRAVKGLVVPRRPTERLGRPHQPARAAVHDSVMQSRPRLTERAGCHQHPTQSSKSSAETTASRSSRTGGTFQKIFIPPGTSRSQIAEAAVRLVPSHSKDNDEKQPEQWGWYADKWNRED